MCEYVLNWKAIRFIATNAQRQWTDMMIVNNTRAKKRGKYFMFLVKKFAYLIDFFDLYETKICF